MWNNYFSGRPRRDVPQHNYKESSDEDDESLVSPCRPPVTRAGSPAELAIPQLNDNVDEDLEKVNLVLKNVGHSKLFRPDFKQEVDQEEVVVGHVVGTASGQKVEADPPHQADIMVNYDMQNADDDEGAIQNARDVKLPFNKNDIMLWFTLVEGKMQFAGIKKQWSKRQVLVQLIPPEYHSDFKQYLVKQETEAGNVPYHTLKTAIIKKFGPRRAEGYDKAVSRVMTDSPSHLGQQIISDICPNVDPLTGCHCADIVLGIWRRALPLVVRNAIADMDFTAGTFSAVFDKADSSPIHVGRHFRNFALKSRFIQNFEL